MTNDVAKTIVMRGAYYAKNGAFGGSQSQQSSTGTLVGSAIIDATATDAVTVYTAPSGTTLFPTNIVIVSGAGTFTSDLTAIIGTTAETDRYLSSGALFGFTPSAAKEARNIVVTTAHGVPNVILNPSVGATGTAPKLRVLVYGFLVEDE